MTQLRKVLPMRGDCLPVRPPTSTRKNLVGLRVHAPAGQTVAHSPQPTQQQVSLAIFLSSVKESTPVACFLHASMHMPQPMHRS